MSSEYKSGVKGLVTESNPQDTPMDTLKDCSDVVVARDNAIESRHGIDALSITRLTGSWTTEFNSYLGLQSVYKIPFDSSVSGNALKYVVVNRGSGELVEMSSPSTLLQALTVNKNLFETTSLLQKPVAFTFKESFYIMTGNGLVEMKKDVLSSTSAVQKLVQFPPFSNIQIDTFQDTFDVGSNWLDIGYKVGLKFTYVWNNTYSDNTPREIESNPSQLYEVLHPMALRTQTEGSTVANTTVDKSRIRIRVGVGFGPSYLPFTNYVTNNSNGRKFYLRVYRTKQVPIGEELPPDYYQAFPDVELGATTNVIISASNVSIDTASTSPNTLNFTTDAQYWKNGDVLRYFDSPSGFTIGGLVSGTIDDSDVYYIGNKTDTMFQVYQNTLLGTTGFIPLTSAGTGIHRFYRVYEANLTVNDNGIITLPQLYTNPNQDGDTNGNSIPPIAKSVVQYKNYSVAANIREPLRAYITLAKQPLVKNVRAIKNIGAGIANGNYFFSQFTTRNGAADFYGLTSGDTFGVDSPFFRKYPPTPVNFSGVNVNPSAQSDLPIRITNGPTTGSSDIAFDANFVQLNAQISFRFDSSTTLTVTVNPHYNRTSPYTRYRNLGSLGTYPNFYPDAIPYDKNLEWLQFGGILTSPTESTLPFYSGGTTSGRTKIDLGNNLTGQEVSTPDIYKSNTRGNKKGTILEISAGVGTIALATDIVTISNVHYSISELPSPGIIYTGKTFFSYKTVETNASATVLTFKNISTNSATSLLTGAFVAGFSVSGTNIENVPFYYKNDAVRNTDFVQWVDATGSQLAIEASPVPLTGYYSGVIGAVNSQLNTSDGTIVNPLFKGPLAKSPAQLLDDCVAELVDSLNERAAIAGIAVKFVKTDQVGEFYVESYPGASKVEAQITGDYHTYEPSIVRSSTDWTTIAKYNKNNVRAISIGRYGNPEIYPNSTILAPLLVGNDDKEIVALARNTNYCYSLKEDGIWRLTIGGNNSVAQVDEIVNIDTTTFCRAPNSVQEINEEIIFLSQKGFISINGNDLENIGRPIETEVKTKLQSALNNGLSDQIRAWVNEERRIYGCTIYDTATTYTTYVFNTYTRQWTKFALPVIDATTDEQGRTLYAISAPTLTLSGTGTLQAQIDAVTPGTASKFYLTEEFHTDGLYRNESDQWDYRYIPNGVNLGSGTQVILSDNNTAIYSSWRRIGGTTTDITTSGLAFFVGRAAYYRKSGVFYPCTFVSRNSGVCTIEFTTVPANITTLGAGDGLYAGVPASLTFNPTNLGTPDTNKVFSEYHLHTIEAVSSISMQFLTDSRADYSNRRTFAFNASVPNRTVYRTFIPLEYMRGRWFIRKVNHDVPLERLQVASQTIVIRDTTNTRTQKAPR